MRPGSLPPAHLHPSIHPASALLLSTATKTQSTVIGRWAPNQKPALVQDHRYQCYKEFRFLQVFLLLLLLLLLLFMESIRLISFDGYSTGHSS